MKYYNTLDLDKVDIEFKRRVFRKIFACPYSTNIDVVDTQKGYHIKFWCTKVCDDCRFVFDDQKRYAMDFKRPPHKTHVCFEPFSVRRKIACLEK